MGGGRWRIKLRTKITKLILLTGADGDRGDAKTLTPYADLVYPKLQTDGRVQ